MRLWVLISLTWTAHAASYHFGAVWDGERLSKDGCITVEAEKITAVGPCAGGAVDMTRYTAIPGMIDVHTHMTYIWNNPVGRAGRGAAVVYLARENAAKTLAAGVTTVRDLGSSNYADIAMRDLINKGLMPGPRMFVAGYGLQVPGRGQPTPNWAKGVDEVKKVVKAQSDAGADWIKMYGSTGSGRDVSGKETFSYEEMKAAVDAAHELGKRIAIHSYGPDGARDAVKAGVDALGVYPNVGPIPADNSTITSPRGFNALFVSQAAQPLTQLWKVHLGVMESKVGEELAQERLRQQQLETAHSVRDLYYQIAQTQTQIESAEANEKYLADLQAETDRNVAEQTALKADSLSVRAKLSQQRYQLLTLRDALATRKEALNQLLGRDLEIDFRVEPQPMPDAAEIDLTVARQEALGQRAEVRQARLQSRRASLEVRRERAQYIPDVSAHFTYLALPNVAFVPQNILQAGFMLQWQPFDWGQKRHESESLKDSVKQTALTERDAQEQITQDVNAKFRSLAEARSLLDVTAVAQEAEREKMRVITNRFGQKAALLSDVLQEQAALTQADGEHEKALAGFWSAKAAFDAALGRQ